MATTSALSLLFWGTTTLPSSPLLQHRGQRIEPEVALLLVLAVAAGAGGLEQGLDVLLEGQAFLGGRRRQLAQVGICGRGAGQRDGSGGEQETGVFHGMRSGDAVLIGAVVERLRSGSRPVQGIVLRWCGRRFPLEPASARRDTARLR